MVQKLMLYGMPVEPVRLRLLLPDRRPALLVHQQPVDPGPAVLHPQEDAAARIAGRAGQGRRGQAGDRPQGARAAARRQAGAHRSRPSRHRRAARRWSRTARPVDVPTAEPTPGDAAADDAPAEDADVRRPTRRRDGEPADGRRLDGTATAPGRSGRPAGAGEPRQAQAPLTGAGAPRGTPGASRHLDHRARPAACHDLEEPRECTRSHDPPCDTATVRGDRTPCRRRQAGEDAVVDAVDPMPRRRRGRSDDAVVEPVDDASRRRGRRGRRTDGGAGDDLLVREGDVAGDYLERLLDILDVDGDIDLDVEGDRASVAIVGGQLDRPGRPRRRRRWRRCRS